MTWVKSLSFGRLHAFLRYLSVIPLFALLGFAWGPSVPATGSLSPVASLSTTSLDFGAQLLDGSGVSRALQLTNTGIAPLTLTSVAITGPGAGAYQATAGCLNSPLAPGSSCTIQVQFSPLSVGTQTASLVLIDDADDSPQSVSLTGVGSDGGLTLDHSTIDFGTVTGTVASTVLQVSNQTAQAISISSISIDSDGDFHETDTCTGQSLASGASCTMTVQFQPIMAGERDGVVVIAGSMPTGIQFVALTGVGVIQPTETTTATSAATVVSSATAASLGTVVLPTATPATNVPPDSATVQAPVTTPATATISSATTMIPTTPAPPAATSTVSRGGPPVHTIHIPVDVRLRPHNSGGGNWMIIVHTLPKARLHVLIHIVALAQTAGHYVTHGRTYVIAGASCQQMIDGQADGQGQLGITLLNRCLQRVHDVLLRADVAVVVHTAKGMDSHIQRIMLNAQNRTQQVRVLPGL